MSKGLIALLVLGGAGVIAFFMFGGKANAAGTGGVVPTDTDWNLTTPTAGQSIANRFSRDTLAKAACQAAAAGVPGASCPNGYPGIMPPPAPPINAYPPVQNPPGALYKGSMGVSIDRLNNTGAGHF